MNVKIEKFYVNGQTSSNFNLNSKWNFVIKVGCFEISFMYRTHSWYSHYFIFGISGKFEFFFEMVTPFFSSKLVGKNSTHVTGRRPAQQTTHASFPRGLLG